MKFFLSVLVALGLILVLNGCSTDAVDLDIKDHTYVKYAKKLMGKGEGSQIKDGPQYDFYPSGRKKSEFHIKNGKMNGVSSTWDPNGIILSRVLYKDDRVVKDLLKEHYDEGREVYQVQEARDRLGVSVTTLSDNASSSKAVKNLGREAVDASAVKKVNGRSGNAVRKLGSTSGSAVRKIR